MHQVLRMCFAWAVDLSLSALPQPRDGTARKVRVALADGYEIFIAPQDFEARSAGKAICPSVCCVCQKP